MKKLNVIVVACLMAMSYVSANAQNEQPQTQVDAFCGQTVTITANPSTGYQFVRWENAAGETVSTVNPYNVSINGEDFSEITTYKAIFEAISYTVTASTEVGKESLGRVLINGEEGPAQGNIGDEKTLLAEPSSACYRFVRWSDEDPAAPSVGATRVVTINATNNNYVAIFEQVTFHVNVTSENTNYGTVTISLAQ